MPHIWDFSAKEANAFHIVAFSQIRPRGRKPLSLSGAGRRKHSFATGLCLFVSAILFVACTEPAQSQSTKAEPAPHPDPRRLLFWTPAEQSFGYRNMEAVFPARTVARGPLSEELPRVTPEWIVTFHHDGRLLDVDALMRDANVEGLLVLSHGRVVLERYGPELKPNDRWASFSIAKSITSTLVGAAIQDGYIKTVDDAVTTYLPGLVGSAYDGVTIRNLLTMTSGVHWNEDYRDPKSDVNQLGILAGRGRGSGDPLIDYMAKLPREALPSNHFVYKTGETDLIARLVSLATHKHLADYLSERIWSRAGMSRDAIWVVDASGQETGGWGLSMTLEDYGRFGLFFMCGGILAGARVLPTNWVDEATTWATLGDTANFGYGFQWRIVGDGVYEAIGIFGQAMYFDAKNDVLAVVLSAWPSALDHGRFSERQAFLQAVSALASAQ